MHSIGFIFLLSLSTDKKSSETYAQHHLNEIILKTVQIYSLIKTQNPSSKFQVPSGDLMQVLIIEIWILDFF